MRKSDSDRLDILHTFPCEACGLPGFPKDPIEVHHCVNQQHRKRDHQRTIPLHRSCHTGHFSIHKARKSFRAIYGHEEEMLERVNAKLGRDK